MFFFLKQKTAYEMRISDWSSDVCSSDLVTPEHEKTETVVYPRDLRAPMLVWQGKEALDETDLEADAPPVYIQEKIDPRVLVEHLRMTARSGEPEPELTLLDRKSTRLNSSH